MNFEENLAPYAATQQNSIGRHYAENEHPFRLAYTRDRDRVVHSSAFRRLESKTQVFSYFQNDYYRTRLTHTIEVAQIARTLSNLLNVNIELAEAVALSHDVGHPPFGHAGERALDEFLRQKSQGSLTFNHNIQGLRIAELLERKYPDFPGLNLTFEVREAFAKHGSGRDEMPELFRETGSEPSLEAQVVDLSDSLAYTAHDLDDGILSGLLKWEDLREVQAIGDILDSLDDLHRSDPRLARNMLTRTLINEWVTNAWETTKSNLEKHSIDSLQAVRTCDIPLAQMSGLPLQRIQALRTFLYDRLYKHPQVLRATSKGVFVLNRVCEALYSDPGMLPREWIDQYDRHEALAHTRLEQQVVDYVACLTDASAADLYKQLYDPSHGVHR